MTAKEIIINDRVNYIYEQCRKVGITHHGAIGLLGNLKGENSQFNPMSLEDMYANRYDLTDEEYTRRADAGEITREDTNKTFINDSFGYGLAQWTWSERKQNLLNFAKSLGKSVGDLDIQIQFMFKEMQVRYTKTWAVLTSTDDYRKAVEICVNEYEKPANAYAAIQTRCNYAKEFLETISDVKAEEKTEVDTEKAIAALIQTARAELGYLEKRSNSQLEDKTANAGSNNYTKYADFIDKTYPNFYNGQKNGFAWCDVFVDWCFIQTFGYDKALELLCAKEKSSGAGCIYSAGYYRAKNQFYKTPNVGDQIFFGGTGNETHTGIVVGVNDSTVTTIEGNTSDESGVVANGGGVFEKSYPINHYYISGYGRPNYSLVEKVLVKVDEPTEKPVVEEKPVETPKEPEKGGDTVCKVSLPMLRYGNKSGYVAAAQALLNMRGYNCGEVDGDFGAKTKAATEKFQSRKRLAVDGIIGVDTWTALHDGR